MRPNAERALAETLAAVGMLMMWLCGLCGAFFFISGIWSEIDGHDSEHWGQPIAIAALFLGGLPSIVGFGLFHFSRKWAARVSSAITEDEQP